MGCVGWAHPETDQRLVRGWSSAPLTPPGLGQPRAQRRAVPLSDRVLGFRNVAAVGWSCRASNTSTSRSEARLVLRGRSVVAGRPSHASLGDHHRGAIRHDVCHDQRGREEDQTEEELQEEAVPLASCHTGRQKAIATPTMTNKLHHMNATNDPASIYASSEGAPAPRGCNPATSPARPHRANRMKGTRERSWIVHPVRGMRLPAAGAVLRTALRRP
jgi:hypothetical protein